MEVSEERSRQKAEPEHHTKRLVCVCVAHPYEGHLNLAALTGQKSLLKPTT